MFGFSSPSIRLSGLTLTDTHLTMSHPGGSCLLFAADLPIDCSLPFLFVAILYFMGGLHYSAGAFFATLFSVLLLVLVAQSFGLLVGAVVPIPKTAQTLTTVVALSMVSHHTCQDYLVVNFRPTKHLTSCNQLMLSCHLAIALLRHARAWQIVMQLLEKSIPLGG